METSETLLDICCICLEPVIIPVEPLCFQCGEKEGEISCFSMKRICMLCVETYLELQKNRSERAIKKKCLFCPTTAHLHQLPKNKTFRVDYLMMDRNPSTIVCPLEGCDFQSNHLKVARHIFTECPSYSIECECGFTCPRREMPTHRAKCERYRICEFCSSGILETEMPRHMYYDHDRTRCFTCHEYVSMNHLSDHILTECPERLVACDVCNCFIRHKMFKNHLRRHIVEISKNVQLIKSKLREEEHSYQHIRKILANMESSSSSSATDTTIITATTTSFIEPTIPSSPDIIVIAMPGGETTT